MTKPVVYVETTIPSYLTSEPSRDLIVAANQQVTHTWWRTAAERFDLVVSEFVLEEIDAGDVAMATRRRALLDSVLVLRETADVVTLLDVYRPRLGLTGRARGDLPHLAYAVAYNVDCIATWNCKHLSNPLLIHRRTRVNADLGRPTPSILTPQSLLESVEFSDSAAEEE